MAPFPDPTLSLWALGVLAVLLSFGALRLTVRVAAPRRDNHWDDALAYHVLTGLLLAFPVRAALGSGSLAAVVGAAAGTWILQTLALRWLYRTTAFHAWLLGILHTILAGVAIGALGVGAGVALALWVRGEVLRDPLRALQLVVEWLGFVWPLS